MISTRFKAQLQFEKTSEFQNFIVINDSTLTLTITISNLIETLAMHFVYFLSLNYWKKCCMFTKFILLFIDVIYFFLETCIYKILSPPQKKT